jgi:hypothetical protein
MTMANVTPQEAELVLKIFDLRREAEMRKARNYVGGEFWPQTYDDLVKEVGQMNSDHNRWWRQVISYWEMVAALVRHGAINQDLFFEPGVSGEMFFVYAKFKHLIPEIREKMNSPEFLLNVEKIITGSEAARKRLTEFDKRIAMFRERMKAQMAKAS